MQFAGNNYTGQNLARRCNGQLQDNFTLQARVIAQGPVVDAVDGALVTIENHLDFFITAPCYPLTPATFSGPGSIPDRTVNLCGGPGCESPTAGIFTQPCSVDSITGTGGFRGQDRVFGLHRFATGVRQGRCLFQAGSNRVLAQVGQAVRECQ